MSEDEGTHTHTHTRCATYCLTHRPRGKSGTDDKSEFAIPVSLSISLYLFVSTPRAGTTLQPDLNSWPPPELESNREFEMRCGSLSDAICHRHACHVKHDLLQHSGPHSFSAKAMRLLQATETSTSEDPASHHGDCAANPAPVRGLLPANHQMVARRRTRRPSVEPSSTKVVYKGFPALFELELPSG